MSEGGRQDMVRQALCLVMTGARDSAAISDRVDMDMEDVV